MKQSAEEEMAKARRHFHIYALYIHQDTRLLLLALLEFNWKGTNGIHPLNVAAAG